MARYMLYRVLNADTDDVLAAGLTYSEAQAVATGWEADGYRCDFEPEGFATDALGGNDVVANVYVGYTEYLYRYEDRAHRERRELIEAGYSVSLIAYDGSRDAYVFSIEYDDEPLYGEAGVTDDGTEWQSYRYDGPDA